MNETRVIEKVLGGDVEAYGILVSSYAALLAGAARHLICNMDDAEDLAQETLLDAYRNLSTLRDHQAYRAWVFGILRFKCRDYLRRRKPEALNLDEYAETIAAPAQEDTGDLMDLLNALPLQDREVLAARYIQDLAYRDIAETLKISEEAVRMRCSRARSRLRAITEQRMREALGAFTVFPLSKGFANRVMGCARQIRITPGSVPTTGGMALAKMPVKSLVAIAILIITLSLFLSHARKAGQADMQIAASAKSLQNRATSERRGQVEPKVIEKKEIILVGVASDGSDIHGAWVKYTEIEKAIKYRVEGVGYEWHDWDAHKCMVATQVTQVDDVPAGASVMRLPAGQYAVFTHRLANGGYEGLNSVMNHWLTTGPYEQIGDDSIQVFDERFKGGNQPDSEIDFWIPIKPRG